MKNVKKAIFLAALVFSNNIIFATDNAAAPASEKTSGIYKLSNCVSGKCEQAFKCLEDLIQSETEILNSENSAASTFIRALGVANQVTANFNAYLIGIYNNNQDWFPDEGTSVKSALLAAAKAENYKPMYTTSGNAIKAKAACRRIKDKFNNFSCAGFEQKNGIPKNSKTLEDLDSKVLMAACCLMENQEKLYAAATETISQWDQVLAVIKKADPSYIPPKSMGKLDELQYGFLPLATGGNLYYPAITNWSSCNQYKENEKKQCAVNSIFYPQKGIAEDIQKLSNALVPAANSLNRYLQYLQLEPQNQDTSCPESAKARAENLATSVVAFTVGGAVLMAFWQYLKKGSSALKNFWKSKSAGDGAGANEARSEIAKSQIGGATAKVVSSMEKATTLDSAQVKKWVEESRLELESGNVYKLGNTDKYVKLTEDSGSWKLTEESKPDDVEGARELKVDKMPELTAEAPIAV